MRLLLLMAAFFLLDTSAWIFSYDKSRPRPLWAALIPGSGVYYLLKRGWV